RTIKEVVAERTRRRLALPTAPGRWTVQELRMLGKYPDRELARRLGRPRKQIHDERHRLNIPPWRTMHFKYWTRSEIRLVGKLPDAEVATKTGHTEQAVKLRRLALRL